MKKNKIKFNIYIFLIVLLIQGCSSSNFNNKNSSLINHVQYLASDDLEGRLPGSKGDILASNYIKNQFKENGLTLLDDNGFQYFDIISEINLGSNNKLSFEGENFIVGKDFIPISFGKNTSLNSDIFVAGYGFVIKNDTIQWNDYQKNDINNKWVMIFRGSPDVDNPHGKYSEHISLRKKAMNAKDNSAAGVIFVSGKGFDSEDKLIDLTYDQSQQDIGIPIIHISRILANKILSLNNQSVDGIEGEINSKLENFKHFFINQKINATTDVFFKTQTTQNIIGYIDGNDNLLKDEYIIIGAHYDHLGYGGHGSGSRRPHINEVHNGADDNASGVSIILELAKSIQKTNNKRSILFIAFGAEEMGLIGSKHFVNSGLIDNDKIQTMINLDMVGKLNPEKVLNVSGTKTGIDLEKYLTNSFNKSQLDYAFDSKGYGPSDHSSFYVNDVPVLFFFTGGHADYHTPFDDYDKLNYSGMSLIKNLLFDLILNLDNAPKIKFQESGPRKQEKMPSRFKVTLGIMPDYVYNKTKGLRVDAVLPDKPAFNGGIKDGDIIIKMGDKPVSDIYEYMHRLSEYNKGDKVEVVVVRDNTEIALEIIF